MASGLSPIERAQRIRDELPASGLFAGQEWRTAPEPLALDATAVELITDLGRILLQFFRAANLLYRQSVAGRQPGWVAQWLEQGKPPRIIDLQRAASLKNELPRVIRPDLLLAEDGLRITELDSVPGGIGLTAWLNRTYASLGYPVMGGPDGMIEGFASVFDPASEVHIVVSEESAAYRPEMDWLAARLTTRGRSCQVRDGSPFTPTDGAAVYRFFELFDLDHVPAADGLLDLVLQRRIQLTPPPRSFLEEKMLLGLLWNRRLRHFWRQELGGAFHEKLLQLTPRTWILDPSPLPPHGAIPELNLSDWTELKTLSQRERSLILKVSGFSPQAWGARGVFLGSDLSNADWGAAVDRALNDFAHCPYVLQRYEKPRRIRYQWVDLERPTVVESDGRARLCPYYFVTGQGPRQRAILGGVLATICPADKKIIHGMRDAVMAPCSE
jgi:hypothetical protein